MQHVREIVRYTAKKFYNELHCSIIYALLNNTYEESFFVMVSDEDISRNLNVDCVTIRANLHFLTTQGMLCSYAVKNDCVLYSINPHVAPLILKKCEIMKEQEGHTVIRCLDCKQCLDPDNYAFNFFTCFCSSTNTVEEKTQFSDETHRVLDHVIKTKCRVIIKLKMHPLKGTKNEATADAIEEYLGDT